MKNFKYYNILLLLLISHSINSQISISGDSYKLYNYSNKNKQARDIEIGKIQNNTKIIKTSYKLDINDKDSSIVLNKMQDSSDGSLSIKTWNFKINTIVSKPYSFDTGVDTVLGNFKWYQVTCKCDDESEFIFVVRPAALIDPNSTIIMMFYVDTNEKYKVAYFENEF
jgi:hypothetical protein